MNSRNLIKCNKLFGIISAKNVLGNNKNNINGFDM